MRVLHLPTNAASQLSIMVRAQRAIGLEARGIVLDPHPRRAITQAQEGVRALAPINPDASRLSARWQTLRRLAGFAAAVRWADVIHWHFDTRLAPGDLDLRIVAALRKARIVEFWGSDIRIPEIAVRDNPYLAGLVTRATSDSGGIVSPRRATYPISYQRSRRAQERFARYGFACLVPGPEMPDYVQPDLFPSPYRTEASLNLEEFTPSFPNASERRPVIVHSPSHLAIKGTDVVLAAIEELRARHDFEFRLVHNVPQTEALGIMRDCDIFLDQFIIGSFGTAALEAMALGKPAVCFLKPAVVANLPPDAPFVNANPDNLAEVVSSLLADGGRRNEIGRCGRAFVERHHDAHAVARQMAGIYEELMGERRQRGGDHERRQAC
jgi:glycosyltransferase involved in cell wall biosynthesis